MIVCPDGPAYRIEASGLRAELIVHEMAKFGLSRRKLEQWHGVLAKCETERTRSMTPRAALIHLSHGTRLFEEVDRKGEAGKRPWWNDTILARYSTGLFNGGGCSWYSARRACPIITVAMCDKDALEPVGKWWGVRVTPRHGKAKVCAAGPAYQIRTQGLRARTVVGEMMQIGLSKRKIEQWRKALSQRERAGRTVPR